MYVQAILELLESLFSQTRDTLFVKFQEDGISDYYVWFMRLLTAGIVIFQYLVFQFLCIFYFNI